MEIQNPHDKFFKETFGNVEIAKDFIIHYFPQVILQMIDVDTLEVQKDSFINKELQENFSDLLLKVNICNREGYLYLLFEHKSYRDSGILFQLLKYMIEIWEVKRNKEKVEKLPIVIPLVFYHGQTTWNIPKKLSEYFNEPLQKELTKFIPNFEYILFDVSQYSDDEIKGSAQTQIFLLLFRDILTKKGNVLLQSIQRALYYLAELEDKQNAMGYLETMMRYVFVVANGLTEKDVEQIIYNVESKISGGSELIMTLAEKWREEGEAKAMSKMVTIQLTKKFGILPKEVTESIAKADVPTLESLLTNIFAIETLDEVKRYLNL